MPAWHDAELTLQCRKATLVVAQCDAERNEHDLNSSFENVQSNRWPFKLPVFCSIHWALTSGIEGLSTEQLFNDTFEGGSTVCLAFMIFSVLSV